MANEAEAVACRKADVALKVARPDANERAA